MREILRRLLLQELYSLTHGSFLPNAWNNLKESNFLIRAEVIAHFCFVYFLRFFLELGEKKELRTEIFFPIVTKINILA